MIGVSPPPYISIKMNATNIKKSIELLLEDLQDRQDIVDLRNIYYLTDIEVEGYIDFFADNRICPLFNILRGSREYSEK